MNLKKVFMAAGAASFFAGGASLINKGIDTLTADPQDQETIEIALEKIGAPDLGHIGIQTTLVGVMGLVLGGACLQSLASSKKEKKKPDEIDPPSVG